MKQISLTQGKFAIVDDEDYEYLSQWKWYYASTGYAVRKPTTGIVYMHRLLMGNPEGLEVDHINCNRLDNRRENLRSVTKQQNMLNTKVRSDNSTGYKGVQMKTDYDRRKPYYATIRLGGKRHALGHYERPEDAHAAYVAAARKYHGEFGNEG